MDPFADVAEPAPAPAPAADPFTDVAQPTPDDQLTDEQWRHKYIHFTPAEQAANRVGPVLQAGPAPSFGDRALGVAKGVAGLPIALLNEGIGQSAAGLSGLGAALTGSKDFVDAANSINKETSQRTSGLESGLPLGERASEIGGSILPLLNPVTAPLVPAGMAGQGFVGATNEGATRGQALGKGAIVGAVGAALPGLGRVLAPAVAPIGTALENAVSPLAGRVATGLLQGGAAGTVLGGAEAGSTALYDPELASERVNDIPSTAGLLALLSGGHGALARSPINPHAPVEPIVKPGLDLDPVDRAAFEKTSDPFADVAVDQTIRPAANGEALPAEDAANLRLPEPAPAEPTQEQVAADSTPEADAAHAKTLDPLDAHDPEQLGALGRISGGEETVTDMSPILENRRKLAEMDAQRAAAEEPTQELPPVNDEHNPTEGSGEGDFRDSIGESGPQEPVKAPEGQAPGNERAPDYSHLAPDAQEYLRGVPKFDKEGHPYPEVTPERLGHERAQETIESRRAANDRAGDLGNVAQGIDAAKSKIERDAKFAAKMGGKVKEPAPEIPSTKEIPSPPVNSEPAAQAPRLAPGDRVNAAPERALHSENPVVRDQEKIHGADYVPEAKERAPVREAGAAKAAEEGHEVVRKRLVEKHRAGERWTQEEGEQANAVLDHLGTHAPEHVPSFYQTMLEQGTRDAQAFGARADRVQTPSARRAEAIGRIHLPTAKEARPIQRLQQENAKDKAARAREAQGPSEAPQAKTLREVNAEAKAKLDAKYPALLEEFKKAMRGGGMNALAGRPAQALYNLLSNRVASGVHSFVDLVASLKKDVPGLKDNKDVQESVEEGWERLRQHNPGMGPGGRVIPTLRKLTDRRKLELFDKRIAERGAKIAALKSAAAKSAQKRVAYMKRWGFDLDDPNAPWLNDPRQWDNFLSHLDASSTSLGGFARNTAIGAFHMSTPLGLVKWGTDTSQALADIALRHLQLPFNAAGQGIRALKDVAVGDDPRSNTAWHEYSAYMKAVFPAMIDGTKNFYRSLITEKPVGPHVLGDGEVIHPPSQFTSGTNPVTKGLGIAARQLTLLPLVRAEDSAFKTFAGLTEVAAHAQATAVDANGKRLQGADLAAHLKEEVSNPQSESWRAAYLHSAQQTFTDPIPVVDYLTHMAKSGEKTPAVVKGFANLKVPFVRIATNVAKRALTDYTPLVSDFVTLAKHFGYEGGFHSLGQMNISRELAKAALRWTLTTAAVSWATSKDKTGNAVLTGYAPDKKSKTGFDVRHQAPHSLRMFGHSFDLQRIGAAGKAMGLLADYANGKLPSGLRSMLEDEALVKPFMDVGRAIDDQEKHGDGWARFAAGMTPVPSVVGQIARGTDPYEHVARSPDMAGKGFLDHYIHELQAKWNPDVNPRKVYAGEPVKKDAISASAPFSTMYRLLSPLPLGHTPEYYKAR